MKQLRWALIVLLAVAMINCDDEGKDPEISINKSIVINELMPKNTEFGSDQDGQFDDWIELYNLASEEVDLSGYYLTDSKKQLTKWKFPQGTKLAKNGYLIVWADGDSTTQVGLHTNYKLSALGETVLLITPEMNVIEEVKYPATELQQSWSRVANGTGAFKWSEPTFEAENK